MTPNTTRTVLSVALAFRGMVLMGRSDGLIGYIHIEPIGRCGPVPGKRRQFRSPVRFHTRMIFVAARARHNFRSSLAGH